MTFDWNEPSARGQDRRAAGQGPSARHFLLAISPMRINGIGRADRRRRKVQAMTSTLSTSSGGPTRFRTWLDRNAEEPAASDQLQRGNSVPLSAVAKFRYELEQPLIARRDRIPTITVQGGRHRRRTQPATIVEELKPSGRGFHQDAASWVTRSKSAARSNPVPRSQGPIIAVAPADAVCHGDDPDDPAAELPAACSWCFAVAPLGADRCRGGTVARAMRLLGFVAILGVLALVGILIRNSVILVVQIEHVVEARAWTALARRRGGYRTSHAADHADGSGGNAGPDPHLA